MGFCGLAETPEKVPAPCLTHRGLLGPGLPSPPAPVPAARLCSNGITSPGRMSSAAVLGAERAPEPPKLKKLQPGPHAPGLAVGPAAVGPELPCEAPSCGWRGLRGWAFSVKQRMAVLPRSLEPPVPEGEAGTSVAGP